MWDKLLLFVTLMFLLILLLLGGLLLLLGGSPKVDFLSPGPTLLPSVVVRKSLRTSFERCFGSLWFLAHCSNLYISQVETEQVRCQQSVEERFFLEKIINQFNLKKKKKTFRE